jgi:uncharacterized membrane protein YqjE
MEKDSNAQIIGSTQQLLKDVATLVRHELEEAAQELAKKIETAGVGAGMVSASALAGVMTIVCLSALVVVLLSAVLAPWAAILIVTVAWALATTLLAWAGKRKLEAARPFFPEKTVANLKEDLAWARERTHAP